MDISFSEVTVRLILAMLLGAVLGGEREVTEHNAGLRTNALVALGTALFTLISGYAFIGFTSYPHVQFDPTRIASYIVAGIGFLGAGTIFSRQGSGRVRGLTSAATIWIVAAVGMACGAGFYIPACIATVMALFVLVGLRYIEAYMFNKRTSSQKALEIQLSSGAGEQVIGKIYSILTKFSIEVERISMQKEDSAQEEAESTLKLHCRIKYEGDLMQAIDEFRKIAGVKAVTMMLHKGVFAEMVEV
ncbi:MgtC family membrane protein [Ktedonobacteria bacterium brp13]|nr:MgtC family membrane protein [Ktedonobacteria bacterium brp13]